MSLGAYLNALFGAEPNGAWAELRTIAPAGQMVRRRFCPARDCQAIACEIDRSADRANVYMGVAPRARRQGGRDAIERCHVVWADCDSPEAIDALDRFEPAPSIVIRSGGGKHAYWPLWPPLAPAHAERANRRLAHALGADGRATDAARILRPPGTLNHKSNPPRQVELERIEAEVYTAREVVGELSDPPVRRATPPAPRTRRVDPGEDALDQVAPPVYVAALAGVFVADAGATIRCPLPDHEDRDPSCHVYPDAQCGWFCFGCERGGTIFDLAAALWSIEPRGAGFHELRERLSAELVSAPIGAAA